MNREELITRIIYLEWSMFQATQNAGGRADCQDDYPTFEIMRTAQAKIWADDTLESYLTDLELAESEGDNLIAYKYGYMMEVTFPDEYARIKNQLPSISPFKLSIVKDICEYHSKWAYEAHLRHPILASQGRPITSAAVDGGKWAAIDNYLRSELLTYSEQTLMLCLRDTKAAFDRGENLALTILKNTAAAYGYQSLDSIENALGRSK